MYWIRYNSRFTANYTKGDTEHGWHHKVQAHVSASVVTSSEGDHFVDFVTGTKVDFSVHNRLDPSERQCVRTRKQTAQRKRVLCPWRSCLWS